jgi:hypothetical protein
MRPFDVEREDNGTWCFGRPTRTVRIGPVTGGSWRIRSTLRTETAVRAATVRSGIPAALRT